MSELSKLTDEELIRRRAVLEIKLNASERQQGRGTRGLMAAFVYAAQLNMIDAELETREGCAPKFLSEFPDSFVA